MAADDRTEATSRLAAGRRRVLVFSPDLLPLPGLPTVGSGLRAWGLGQGLQARGHDVVFSMPQLGLDALRASQPIAPSLEEHAWRPFAMHEVVESVQPNVILVCGWPIMESLAQAPSHEVPVVLDQHGPHMLERHFQGVSSEQSSLQKQRALAAADYFSCAGQRQLPYFREWLQRAGWTEEECAARSFAMRFSLSPNLPARAPAAELTFVYGGVWLPWQDPTNGLRALVEELDQRGHGVLRLFGGKHPWLDIDGGIFLNLTQQLAASEHVIDEGQMNHADLIRRYTSAHVATDLMSRNPERELAVTSRTVEYLWCGLPVIYNDYSELSDLIRDYDAGWTVDPEDIDSIHAALNEIFTQPEMIEHKSENARRLVRELLAWDETTAPLDDVVRAPSQRAGAERFKRVSALASGKASLAAQAWYVYRNYGGREVARRAIGLMVRLRRQHRSRDGQLKQATIEK